MLFCSKQYLVFFSLVFVLYWSMPGHRLRVWLLLIASFTFYASWNHWLALLICISTVIDFVLARGMDRYESPHVRKLLLAISLVGNLGLLTYFKYANFFLDSLSQGLAALGLSHSLPTLSVILPVGISFYTFEAINYTVDVYRRRIPAERSLANFMLFITFFPHLVAGPIVRARDFLPQVTRPKRFDWMRMQLGVQLFLLGLFKKLAIADRMALYVDPVFQNPQAFGSSAMWMATIAYALQIYCDFSGYSDMALGSAHMLGYKLARNFDMPYIALNVVDFWRRWHISLSTWLRDYLYIPLGGNRGSAWFTFRNLLITMALGGLWHGASWHFVIWGVLHGLYLIIHRLFQALTKQATWLDAALQTLPGFAWRMSLTFAAVCAGWVVFRAQDLTSAWIVLQRLAIPQTGQSAPLPYYNLAYTLIVVALAHWLAQSGSWKRLAVRLPEPVLGFGYALQLALALALAPDTGNVFIYFQF